MRKTFEELEAIKKKLNCHTLYSWSRYNTYKTCSFEYMLKYVKNTPEDRKDGIYSISGGICHSIIERLYSNEITYDQMLEEYETELLNFNLCELKYDRTSDEKNEKIAEKYESCIRHFFQHHKKIQSKVDLERFITVSVPPFHMQGYVDVLFKEGDYYIVGDWKSSSIYTGKKILKEQGQILLYCEALRQLGVPLDKIKGRWNFLKYVTIDVPQANGKLASRNIERNEIGSKLASNVQMWMKKVGYGQEDIDSYVSTMSLTNDIECLPDEIKSKYEVKDCWIDIEISEEAIEELKKDISDTLIEINKKEAEYLQTKDENIWWKDVTDESSYYFANLSGFSASIHKPYKVYLEAREVFKNSPKENDDSDLSWLNELN